MTTFQRILSNKHSSTEEGYQMLTTSYQKEKVYIQELYAEVIEVVGSQKQAQINALKSALEETQKHHDELVRLRDEHFNQLIKERHLANNVVTALRSK